MKPHWPILFFAAGFFILVGGFTYDVLFAGIPFQDPTPEMTANFDRHAHVASVIRWCGVGGILLGILFGGIRRVVRHYKL